MKTTQIDINTDQACKKCGQEGTVNDTHLCMECIGEDAAQLLHLDVRTVSHKSGKTIIEYREKGAGGDVDLLKRTILQPPSEGFLESLKEIGEEMWTELALKDSLIVRIDITDIIIKDSDAGDRITVKGVALGPKGGTLFDIKSATIPLTQWVSEGASINLLMTRAARFVVNRQVQADLFTEVKEAEKLAEPEIQAVEQQNPEVAEMEPVEPIKHGKPPKKTPSNPAGVTMLDEPLPGSEAEAQANELF
ncbi:hypothetical protein LCGC14_0428550 [marine sediment metagenome]|uniref:Uncharacterized protein n=1 Tax=marine sediment metagenome TaxID=412755 RepID=A0A0F9SNS2_9ZZZZ